MKITILSEIRERFRKLLEDKPIEVEEYNIYLSWDLDNGTELDGKTIWSFFLPHLKDNTTEHDKKIAEEAVMGFVKKLNPYLFKNCKLKRTDDAIEDICSFMDKHLSSRGDKGEQI